MKLYNVLFEINEISASKIIDIQTEHGSLDAVVHHDINRVINWAEKERLSPETKQKLSELPLPIVILKNIWVDEESRGHGAGSELMSKFFDEANSASSFVLIADSEQSQSEGFNLIEWYESYDFEVVGESGSGPVMVYIP